jgi:hypothetical protein
MKKMWLFLPILVFSSGLASATDSSLEDQLRKTYAGSQQMLGHFYAAATLKFDVNGNPSNKEKEGPWTLLSGVLIENVTLKPKKLELHGHRRMLVIDEKTKTFRSIKLDEKFSIEIIHNQGRIRPRSSRVRLPVCLFQMLILIRSLQIIGGITWPGSPGKLPRVHRVKIRLPNLSPTMLWAIRFLPE